MEDKVYLSVVMAEYNTKETELRESINSILNQTYQFFELIIVDDCGKNNVENIVKSFKDNRIKVIKNEKNIGLAESLNKGIKCAKYNYILRMDTDDICFKDRFEKQIKFALEHPEYSIIGGKHVYFDENGEYESRFIKTGEIIEKDFLYNTPFSHPTLLIKKDDLINLGGYPNYKRGQDYAMEMQMYSKGCKGYIMDEILIKYRQDKDGYKKKNYKSRVLEYKIRKKYFKKLNLPFYRGIFIIKPLIVGLIPLKLLKKYHEININNKIKTIIKRPENIIVFTNNKLMPILSDEKYLKIVYKAKTGKKLNIENPQTFNEKLQWLKLYDRNPEYTKMVDKYEAKKYVANIIGEEYIIPTLGVYDKFEDINFATLPNQFVIKCTHDSGGLIICKDKTKLNIKEARKKINKSLKRNYFYTGREWPYKNVKPRIIAEEYMEDQIGELIDYKVYAFNGQCDYVMVCFDRIKGETKFIYYDRNWNIKKEFSKDGIKYGDTIKIEKPKNLDKMFEFAEILSKNIPFVRVDFYESNGNLYFGELTFYPSAGFDNTRTKDCQEYLDKQLKVGESK